MKKFYQFFMAMLFIVSCNVGVLAQITCQEFITVELSAIDGTATISIEDVVTGEIPEGTVLSQNAFDCNDLGSAIDVVATSGEQSCKTAVNVVDLVPPVAIADVDVELEFPSELEVFSINPTIIDDGSWDLCGSVFLSVEPESLTCDMIGQSVAVTLNVKDESGNENSAQSILHISGSRAAPLACEGDFSLNVQQPIVITRDFILLDDQECIERLIVLQDENGNIIESNTLTSDLEGQVVIVTVEQPADEATCSTRITITGTECEAFEICDTACNSSAIDDCASGHTGNDGVEWPCDLVIDQVFPGVSLIEPSVLMSNFDVPLKDTEPEIILSECHIVNFTYNDEVFFTESGVKVHRNWIVVDWLTGNDFPYQQEILFDYADTNTPWNICDTESNTAELGDCGSGHSNDDDVEWPSDVSALDHRITPDELLHVAGITNANIRPSIVSNAEYYRLGYEDGVISATANYSLVARKWTITSTENPGLKADYTQHITIPVIRDAEKKVFITTHGGRPMPGVTVNDAVMTDGKGVAIVEGLDEIVLEYEDDPLQGLDVMDEVLIYKYVLGEIAFPNTPYPGMDINDNGTISTLDIVLLRQLISGDKSVDEFDLGWRFHERTDPLTNVRADFVSYKMGDADDSALLASASSTSESVKIVLDDLLLNEGEEYEISMKMDAESDIYGGQIIFQVDPENVEIIGVSSDILSENVSWKITEGELLHVYIRNDDSKVLMTEQSLMKIQIKALGNSTIGTSLRVSPENSSFVVLAEVAKAKLVEELRNEITSGLAQLTIIEEVSIKPNPASNEITIEMEKGEQYYKEIYNAQGSKILTTQKNTIDISGLSNGIYYIHGFDKSTMFSRKFVKI